MAEATDDVERATTPLTREESKIYVSSEEIKEVQKSFNNVIDNLTVDNTSAKLEEFKGILNGRKIEKMEAHYKHEEKSLKNVMALLLLPNFLTRFSLQEVLLRMLKDIAKYREFLKLFIERFNAHNERIEAKRLLKNDTKMDKTKKQLRPIIHSDPRTMRELDAPLHCAVRQLNEGFIEWLLEQPETEVNLRNKRRETALAILCFMYDWNKEITPKLKTRLKDIEKERETADETKKIELDAEKIELVALEMQLKEEMNAPTILNLIKILLVKGADFNIYMNDGALPFDFLRKYDTEVDLDEIIKDYAKSNIAMTVKAQKQSNASAEVKNDTKKRMVKFYKKTEDMDVRVTEELLEIFIWFQDLEKFENYWKDFQVTGDNVKKVITLLLHVAVERNYTTYVVHIIKKASKEIFKLDEIKATDTDEPTQNETNPEVLSRWRYFKCCPKTPTSDESNPSVPDETNPRAQRQNSKDCRLTKGEENKMVHRNELKGLLKMVCLNGNKALLRRFLIMMHDRLLVNETPLLINTLNRAFTMKQKKESIFLLECVKHLIYNHSKIDMYLVDSNGNTALHLALSYGYDKIASLMLKNVHGLLRFRNHQNLTPIEYGTTEFWNSYLDNCINTNNVGSELRFNVGFLKPRAKDESSDTSKSSSSKWYLGCVKHVEEIKSASKYRFTRTVTDMTSLRLISQSTDRKEFLLHPVIIAFITMKWKRLCHWNILNLLLTAFTMGTFIGYTLMPCPSVGWKCFFTACVILGSLIISVREIMQLVLLRWSYFRLENLVDFLNLVFIGIVLGCGCKRGGMCEYVSSFSSFLFVSFSIQATFLLGATWNNLFITFYMFKTVSSSFFKSFLSFTPVIGAFICCFYRMYNEPSGISVSNGTESNSSEQNFNNFHSWWDAAIKTLVMTTGEFEAANINYDGARWLLFVAFLFIAPIVILNLINGLAVSDIADIRQQSEFISAYKKVRLLERYERVVVESRSIMPRYLQWLFREPFLPSPFFEKYESIVYVLVNEKNKLEIKSKKQRTTEPIPCFPWLSNFCLKHYIGICSIQLVPYMSLNQSYVNKAKTIVRRHYKNNSGRGTNELAETEQTDGLALVNKTAMNPYKTSTLCRSATCPSVPDSRDKQIEMLQGQVRSMIAMLNDIQQQLAGNHAMKTESTGS